MGDNNPVREKVEQYFQHHASKAITKQREYDTILNYVDHYNEAQNKGSAHIFNKDDKIVVEIHCPEVTAHIADLFRYNIVRDRTIEYEEFDEDSSPEHIIVELILDLSWLDVVHEDYNKHRNDISDMADMVEE